MKKVFGMTAGILLILGLSLPIFGCMKGKKTEGGGTENAMEKPVYDYVEGWYDKDPERMKEGLHPYLVKRSPDPGGKNGIRDMDLDSLLAVLSRYGGQNSAERKIDIEIFDTANNIATARVISNDYVDYVHLGYIGDRWQIINVLWEFPGSEPKELTPEEISAVEKPVRDYIEGWYDKDPERLKEGLHPDLAKRNLNTSRPEGIDQYTLSDLIALVPRYGGCRGGERIVDIEILDVGNSIASVKVTSNEYIDYLHLCRIKDRWQILNVLWCRK